MRRATAMVLMVYLFAGGEASAGAPAAETWSVDRLAGRWRTVRHGALVDIKDCGDNTPCGALAWVDPSISEGHTRDVRNRDPDLRDRPLIGAPILWGFEPGEGGWRDGRLYNPDDGKTFRARLQPLSDDALRVVGCLGPFCRAQTWTRADGAAGANAPQAHEPQQEPAP